MPLASKKTGIGYAGSHRWARSPRDQRRRAQRLVRQLARRARQEHAADLEDPHAARPGARVAPRGAQEPGQQRADSSDPCPAIGFGEAHAPRAAGRPAAGAARRGPRARAREAGAARPALRGPGIARALEQRERRGLRRPARSRPAAAVGLEPVVAVDARDLLAQVRRDREIVAPARDRAAELPAGSGLRAHADPREQGHDLVGREARAEQAIRVRGIERDLVDVRQRRAERLDPPARDGPASELRDQARAAVGGARDAVAVDAALEAVRGLGAQAEPARGCAAR